MTFNLKAGWPCLCNAQDLAEVLAIEVAQPNKASLAYCGRVVKYKQKVMNDADLHSNQTIIHTGQQLT